MIQINLPVGPTGVAEAQDPLAGFDFGGGGGGGGFAGPEYVAPDRRVVEDFVKGSLVSLVGNIPGDDMVQRFTDVYMNEHRKNFDTPNRTIDPAQSVTEAIRGTAQYKTIHQNRPDSEDERSWISQRSAAAAQGGLTVGAQENFAITQATVAGDVEDVRTAAGFAQLQRSGKAPTLLDNQFRQVAQGIFGGVRR